MILPWFRAVFLQCYLLTVEMAKIVLKIRKTFGKFSLEVIKIYTKFQPKSDAWVTEDSVHTTAALPALSKIKDIPSDSSQTRRTWLSFTEISGQKPIWCENARFCLEWLLGTSGTTTLHPAYVHSTLHVHMFRGFSCNYRTLRWRRDWECLANIMTCNINCNFDESPFKSYLFISDLFK